MYRWPPFGTGEGNAGVIWCLATIVPITFLAISPTKFFRILSMGRPLPRFIGNRGVLIFYRVTAVALLIWVLRILFSLFLV